MKRLLITAVVAASLMGSSAQINSTTPSGTLLRAAEMYADSNYHGCLDQLSDLPTEALSPTEARRAAYFHAMALVHTDKAAALLELEHWLARYPSAPEADDVRMAIADCVYGTDYYEALELYYRVNPEGLTAARRDELTYRMAYSLLQTGDLRGARRLFGELAELPDYRNASLFYQGYIDYSQGRYGDAEQLLLQVVPVGAPGDMAPYYLSQIYYNRGDYKQALERARKILSNPPAQADGLCTAETNRIAGESLFALGDRTAAVPYVKKYVSATEAPLPSALYVLGLDAFEGGDYGRALGYLQDVTGGDDAMSQSANLLVGQALMKEADYDGAIIAFDKALNMDYDREVKETAFYNYAVAADRGGKVPFGSAVATFKQFLKLYPESKYAPAVQEYIITSYITDNNYQAALDGINEMKNPSQATLAAKQQVLYTLGARTLQSGDAEKAMTLLKEARTLGRYNAETDCEVGLLLGDAAYRLDDYETSRTELTNYLARAPKNADNRRVALYDLGYTLFSLKDYDGAAKNFRELIDNPGATESTTLADAWNRLGDCLYYRSDFAGASEAYNKAYAANPASGDYALFQQAVMLGYGRDYKRKISLLSELKEKFPNSPLIPDALLEVSESHLRLGYSDKAVETYRELVENYPNTAQGRQGNVQLALTLMNSGKRAEAVDRYKHVISAYPTSDEAAIAAAELKRICAADGTIADYMAFLASVPSAPQLEADEADRLSFEAAEQEYIENSNTKLLARYLADYPKGASRLQALGYMMESATDHADQEATFRYASEIVNSFPDSPSAEDALIAMAGIEMERGRGNSAMRLWKTLADKASSPTILNTVRMGIMRTARESGDNAELLAAADAVLASTAAGLDDRYEAIFSKGVALANTGRNEEARKQWAEISDRTDDLYGIKSAVAIASSYLHDGRLAEAEKAAAAVTGSGSQHFYWVARAFIVLADVYTAQGNEYKAQQFLQSLRQNYPGDESDIILMIDQRIK